MGNILHTNTYQNVGQVKEEEAQAEIDRLTKIFPHEEWRTDTSPLMYVWDDTDDSENPARLHKGYVWVTCTPSGD